MSEVERKILLKLFPFFSKDPIIFDVGSNKGTWADVLVHNVSEMHLFEPNTDVLTYTKVKYDYLTNVRYIQAAVTENHGREVDFYFLTNENNELSSIFEMDVFQDLPVQMQKVKTISIDEYCRTNKIKYIDFLKVDAEGADYLVLIGAEKMLKKQSIKFVQVEVGHIDVSKVSEYMSGYGYKMIDTDDRENKIFAPMEFTQDWNQEFIKNTAGIPKFNFALEIGCFEGLTSRYICDNMLLPGGRMICIDPLEECYLPGKETELDGMFKGQHERFVRNTRTYPIELIRKKSQDVFSGDFMRYRFDFIYIDGDHSEEAVYQDGKNAFEVLQNGGHMLFDDYLWRDETKSGIDKFLGEFAGAYDIRHSGYQILIQKR